MRRTCIAALAVTCMAGSFSIEASAAAEPVGEWLVQDGTAQVRIENCNGQLWGAVSWAQRPGERDVNNPDPAKRSRPVLGMPLLIAMKPNAQKPGRYEGEVYNAQNGKSYESSIQLSSDDVLRIEGCLLGFLCGGQNWTRVKPTAAVAEPPRGGRAAEAPRSRSVGQGGQQPSAAAAPMNPATASSKDFCAAVAPPPPPARP